MKAGGGGDPGAHPLSGAGTSVAGVHSSGCRYGGDNREFTYYGRKKYYKGRNKECRFSLSASEHLLTGMRLGLSG
jgi:hypothetical protein